MAQPEFALLMAPSPGILDNWLPVICKIRETHPNAKISVIIPHQGFADNLEPGSVLLHLADKMINQVIWLEIAGIWNREDTMMSTIAARAFAQSKPSWKRELRKLYSKLHLLRKPNLNKFVGKDSTLCYCISSETQSWSQKVWTSCSFPKAFSINHGIDVAYGGKDPSKREDFSPRPSSIQPTVFMFSQLENKNYSASYTISEENQVVVGIPRHEAEWVDLIQQEEKANLDKLPVKFVGLISRPQNDLFLPLDRKIKGLEALKLVAAELGLPIVIKRHPKETRTTSVYDDVFGPENLGKTWFETSVHWLALGPQCAFTMSFVSGVVADMAILGVPTVEWLDLTGLPSFDHPDGLKLPDGTPVHTLRYLGVVPGATTLESLRDFAQNAIADREGTAVGAKAKYYEVFGSPQGSIQRVIDKMNIQN
ncbi:MAG: hypothetical protein ACI875_001719 [Planctomycetota bacterium]|jgi:hypothetical protein